MINKLKEYNAFYMSNNSYGKEEYPEVFKYKDRKSKLILSAPHATKSFVSKKEKPADLYTGAIVEYIGEQTETSTLIRTKYVNKKVLISDYVANNGLENHFFVDVHGFDKDIEYDVCLGIYEYEAKGYPYLEDIIAILEKYDLRTIVNYPDYTGRNGFTRRYQEQFGKPNIIQMELKRYLRDFYQNPEIVEKTTIPMMIEIANCNKN
ncbi:MAG: hypothetical protein Q4D11_02890 [Rhodospirillales bacterium]|nr:hypothetical protein [Rhodospirillales bacterium]